VEITLNGRRLAKDPTVMQTSFRTLYCKLLNKLHAKTGCEHGIGFLLFTVDECMVQWHCGQEGALLPVPVLVEMQTPSSRQVGLTHVTSLAQWGLNFVPPGALYYII